MSIPSFRRWKAPSLVPEKRRRFNDRQRGSARERGYDGDWEKLAKRYLKSVAGRCEECMRRGYLVAAEVVDHMEPVRDNPERRLDWSNLDALCRNHHDGFKRKIEAYARKTGAVSLLPRWVKHPDTRPTHFRILKRGPMSDLFDEDHESIDGAD